MELSSTKQYYSRTKNQKKSYYALSINKKIFGTGHRMTWKQYHRLEDIHGFLDYLAKTYPKIASVNTIGKSHEGRDLKVCT